MQMTEQQKDRIVELARDNVRQAGKAARSSNKFLHAGALAVMERNSAEAFRIAQEGR